MVASFVYCLSKGILEAVLKEDYKLATLLVNLKAFGVVVMGKDTLPPQQLSPCDAKARYNHLRLSRHLPLLPVNHGMPGKLTPNMTCLASSAVPIQPGRISLGPNATVNAQMEPRTLAASCVFIDGLS